MLDVELPQRIAALGPLAVGPSSNTQPCFGRPGRAHEIEITSSSPLSTRNAVVARGPRADRGDPQVVAPGLGGELGVGIGRDPLAQRAVDAAEAAVLADLLGGGRGVEPLAFVELCHARHLGHRVEVSTSAYDIARGTALLLEDRGWLIQSGVTWALAIAQLLYALSMRKRGMLREASVASCWRPAQRKRSYSPSW